ncbi:MAG: hypothetical protein M0Q88_09555 [Bacilli bacterium]|nr:hypothetical protein [Bacilli bacterium]
MKYLKKFNENINTTEIDSICEKYNITNYTINNDGSIDVDGNVYLKRNNLRELPLKFRNVVGNFYCSNNQLTSLEGAPKSVGGFFDCRNNQLTSLVGCPQYIGGGFYCRDNKLTSLVGCPQSIGGSFYCSDNKLTSLEGAPKRVGGIFLCYSNNLKNIDYLPKYYKELDISNNPISKIIKLFTTSDRTGVIYDNREDKDLIMDFIDREIIQQDKLLVNRLVEFLDDIGNPISREELIKLLKNNYEIR